MYKALTVFTIVAVLFSCSPEEKKKIAIQEYTGPMIELEDVVFLYSDSALVKVKGITPLRMEFANGDQEFPKGLYLEFYNEEGIVESTIDAKTAFYIKEEDHWIGREGVVVVDTESGKNLKTEELYWEPAKERIFTDKFVTISDDKEVLYGKGLDAKQDLSEYTIKEPTGDFQLEDDNGL